MAGRPKLLALRKRIAENDLEDEIFEAVAEGMSIGNLCEKFDITSRKMFYDWKRKEGPTHDKYLAARLIAAEAHAEKAGEILDELKDKTLLTGPDVQAATSRSKYQQWLASVKDRDSFGAQDKGPTLNLSFGDLHLDALRNAMPQNRIEMPEVHIPFVQIDDGTPPITSTVTGTDGPEMFISLEDDADADFEEIVGVGNDGEAEAHSGPVEGPITPLAPALAAELGDLL